MNVNSRRARARAIVAAPGFQLMARGEHAGSRFGITKAEIAGSMSGHSDLGDPLNPRSPVGVGPPPVKTVARRVDEAARFVAAQAFIAGQCQQAGDAGLHA